MAGLLAAAALGGCGGGGDANVGGTVSGLEAGSSVTLQLNDGEMLIVSADGPFRFEDEVLAGARYEVTVVGQPSNAACTVTNGSGRIGEDARGVENVIVTCTRAFSVGGRVEGLSADSPVVLRINGGETVTVSENTTFRFPTRLPQGTAYQVLVSTQPTDRECTVEAGNGTVGEANVIDIAVTCS
ncbi:MAG TPA: hypothetical protein VFZ93_05715 [Albitalea sp.]